MTNAAPPIEAPSETDEKDREPIRVLWVGPAPWLPSHYGLQAKYAIEMLTDEDFEPEIDLAVMATDGLAGVGKMVDEFSDVPLYGNPYGTDPSGKRRATMLAMSDFNPDAIIYFGDLSTMGIIENTAIPQLVWANIDHEPLPPAYHAIGKQATVIAATSRRGAALIGSTMWTTLSTNYIPHVVPPPFFAATSSREARTVLQIPMDDYVIGMVGNNIGVPPRKGFVEGIEAFARITDDYPKARLLLWTQPDAPWGGVSLRDVAHEFGVVDKCYIPDAKAMYVTHAEHGSMQQIYSAMDCLLYPSYGEGFGLAVAEAMAVGVPVIAPRHTGMLDWPDEAGVELLHGVRHRTSLGANYVKPDVPSMAQAIQTLITATNIENAMMWNAGQQYALNHYTAEQASPAWASAMGYLRTVGDQRKLQAQGGHDDD